MRGEYCSHAAKPSPLKELPPRARRILKVAFYGENESGTTSACAENTLRVQTTRMHDRNYLRVRGEYSCRGVACVAASELPPRARRIPRCLKIIALAAGTTSACAENTIGARSRPPAQRNYLRVRGEYSVSALEGAETAELPPRARRILKDIFSASIDTGTTSACAENTHHGRQ